MRDLLGSMKPLVKKSVSRATHKEVQKHTVDGITATMREHAERCGVKYATVITRRRDGATLEEALHKPVYTGSGDCKKRKPKKSSRPRVRGWP